ncbi:MAG: hypothetical protein ACYC6Y_30860 [Thermoguttaceae bacterium]
MRDAKPLAYTSSRALPSWFYPVCLALALAMAVSHSTPAVAADAAQSPTDATPMSDKLAGQLRTRLERALEKWCTWLSGHLVRLPESQLYSMTPAAGTGPNSYRDVAGNQFAAAAAGYWLAHASPDPQTAAPLRGLIDLALGSHVAVKAFDRPDVPRWGATISVADNWHADLFAASAGMLMPGGLTPSQDKQLLAILAWEADKQVEYGVSAESRSLPGRWPAGSVGESNAWSTALLQAARVRLPDSPRQAAWREAAILYSLNTLCLPDDLASDEVVAGRPLRNWVRGANFEPGGIQEHHGFYHPGYVAWPLAYEAFAELNDGALPLSSRNLDVYLHHWKFVFDRLKQGTFANGRLIHCAGDDWNAYGYGNDHILPIALFAASRFRDPDSSCLALGWLSLMEESQSMTAGSIQGARLARIEKQHHNDFAWYESISGATLAHALWVLDHLEGKSLPVPSTEAEYNANNQGTYIEPNSRLAWYRDEHHWVSSSWRAAFGQWQTIVQPVGLPHLLKFNHNSMGTLAAAATTGGLQIRSARIEPLEGGGFWSLGVVDRLHPQAAPKDFAIRQYQAVVAFPGGPVLWVDRCQALVQVNLSLSGSLGLRLAADIFNGSRVRLAAQGRETVFELHPDRDTWHDLQTCRATIEQSLTLEALAGEGGFQLLQKQRRDPNLQAPAYAADRFAVEESLLGHELYFGPPECRLPKTVPAREFFRNVVLRIDCDPATTPATASAQVHGDGLTLVAELPDAGRSVAINFGDAPSLLDTQAGPITVQPQTVKVAPR